MRLEELINKTTKEELLYIVNILNDIKGISNPLEVVYSLMNCNRSLVNCLYNISMKDISILTNINTTNIINDSSKNEIYQNLLAYSDNEFNEFSNGKAVDPVTKEPISPSDAVKIGRRMYDSRTAKSILAVNPKDPFTRDDLDISSVERRSSVPTTRYNTLMQGSPDDGFVPRTLFGSSSKKSVSSFPEMESLPRKSRGPLSPPRNSK